MRNIYQKYFNQNFANDLICLASLTVPHLNVSTEIAGNVEFEIDTQIIAGRRGSRSQTTQILVILVIFSKFCPFYVAVAVEVCLRSLL